MQSENGAEKIVNRLRIATHIQRRNEAAAQLAALIQTKPTDRAVLQSARAADVVADSISAFRGDVIITQVALGALWHVWIPPVDTERILTIVMDEMARHQNVLLLQQAGLRILRMHAASPQQLLLAPSILTAVGRAMKSHRDDDTIQHWGAESICCLASIDPADVITEHGEHQCAEMSLLARQLAIDALRPATLLVGGAPWHQLIMELYPSPVG